MESLSRSVAFVDQGFLKPVSYTHLDVYKRQKVLSVTDTINGYDSITEEVLVTDEVDPGTCLLYTSRCV